MNGHIRKDVIVVGSGATGLSAAFADLQSPFYAMPFKASFLGTKGGARTNEKGEVLDRGGAPIPGLYAAGNAMANSFGSKGVGAGTTLGPCLTWGYIAGMNAARES